VPAPTWAASFATPSFIRSAHRARNPGRRRCRFPRRPAELPSKTDVRLAIMGSRRTREHAP